MLDRVFQPLLFYIHSFLFQLFFTSLPQSFGKGTSVLNRRYIEYSGWHSGL